jgi:hypothetical protein
MTGTALAVGAGFISSRSAPSPFPTAQGSQRPLPSPSQFPLDPLHRSPTDAHQRSHREDALPGAQMDAM